jgi:hypothetical protein
MRSLILLHAACAAYVWGAFDDCCGFGMAPQAKKTRHHQMYLRVRWAIRTFGLFTEQTSLAECGDLWLKR